MRVRRTAVPTVPTVPTVARVAAAAAVVAVVAGAITLAAAPGPASAAVAVDQSYPVPTSGVLTLHGHGFGHGHGMSQYGAYGAARQGLDYRRILGFYYPGTTLSTMPGRIRVRITADTTPDLVVGAVPGLVVRDLGDQQKYVLPTLPGVTRWRLDVDAAGRSVLGYYDGRWHRYQPGGRPTLVGDGRFHAPVPLTLWTPSGTRAYRGYLVSASPEPGSSRRETVDDVSLSSYLKGVVPAEMPASWSAEALKAQAVAARTYALWSRDQDPNGAAQICDTSSCQVYRGYSAEDPRSNAAVDATPAQVLTYQGRPAFTQFSSSSGGWTSAGSRPYLVAEKDPYDGFAANPVHDWTLRLSAGRVAKAYPAIGRLKRLHVTSRDGHGQWGGRVVSLVLDGTRRDVTLSGDTFRARFGLRSSWFAG
jgi:SpoIID/LytB domain protein